MKIKALIKDLPIVVRGSKDVTITGISAYSKTIAPGNLFIAKKGSRHDGVLWVDEAILFGASAICSEVPLPCPPRVVQLITPDVHAVESELAARFYGYPDRELNVMGITGTNGKTTTSYMIAQLLEALGIKTGIIGTIEYVLGDCCYPSTLTTPDVVSNYRMLREMVRASCSAVVMEVTSHALTQNRLGHIQLDRAIFTNLSVDHLDYHHTMEAYFAAKCRIFDILKPQGVAIINQDCPWGRKISTSPKMTFACTTSADLEGEGEGPLLVTDHTTQVTIDLPFLGMHNMSNFLAALTTLYSQGYPLEALKEASKGLRPVRGRLQPVGDRGIFIDFAHTPDGLTRVINTLKPRCARLIVVFGCGGNRDRTKRPMMGEIASSLADYVIITSDNPRDEDPGDICRMIAMGCPRENYKIILDRKEAIQQALALQGKEDYVLIAGRGSERYQISGQQHISFDDYEVTASLV